MHSHPGKRLSGPLGRGWGKMNGLHLWLCAGSFLPQGKDSASGFPGTICVTSGKSHKLSVSRGLSLV